MLTTLPVPGETPAARHDWSVGEIESIYTAPLLDLVHQAQTVHRAHHAPNQVQGCVLLNVKSGGCPEDCAYCPQSAHYSTGVDRYELMKVDDALDAARRARAQGATRFCMGAAWRDAAEGEEFDRVLDMVRGVRALGHGGLLHARHADAGAGGRAGRRRAVGVQPQPRHVARVLRQHHHDARLRRAPRHARARAPGRHHRLLRRHHRHGRDAARTLRACCISCRRSTRIPKACR